MKEKGKGKAVDAYSGDYYLDYNYFWSCNKHPSSSSFGICAYCLKERLVKLACSDCEDQGPSSCSCSRITTLSNSCSVDVGSVGRVSFLIENDRVETVQQHLHAKPTKGGGSDEVGLLKRSGSSVAMKRSEFWRIGRIFRKKREKGCEKSDVLVFDFMSLSRSRSLSCFRGGGFNDKDEDGDLGFSSAKVSNVNGGIVSDSEKQGAAYFRGQLGSDYGADLEGLNKGGFEELDSVANRGVFPLKGCDFGGTIDLDCIDLKLGLSPELSAPNERDHRTQKDVGSSTGGTFMGHHNGGVSLGSLIRHEVNGNQGSCRIRVKDKGIGKGREGHKVWRWIFSTHIGWRRTFKEG